VKDEAAKSPGGEIGNAENRGNEPAPRRMPQSREGDDTWLEQVFRLRVRSVEPSRGAPLRRPQWLFRPSTDRLAGTKLSRVPTIRRRPLRNFDKPCRSQPQRTPPKNKPEGLQGLPTGARYGGASAVDSHHLPSWPAAFRCVPGRPDATPVGVQQRVQSPKRRSPWSRRRRVADGTHESRTTVPRPLGSVNDDHCQRSLH